MTNHIVNVDDLMKGIYGKNPYIECKNHWLWPQHAGGIGAFAWTISGKVGSGKTNLVIAALVQDRLQFDHLYLYVRNPNQKKYRFLIQWLNEQELELERQTGEWVSIYTVITNPDDIIPIKETNPNIRKLAIFDDMVLDKPSKEMLDYYISGRHQNMSNIYLGQAYHMIDPIIRKQSCYFSVFRPSSQKEFIQISTDLSLGCDYREFKQIFEAATDQTNSFLFVDRRTEIRELELRRNFTGIWDAEHEQFVEIPEEVVDDPNIFYSKYIK